VAVTDLLSSIVIVSGFVDPDRSPDHPVNEASPVGIAVSVTGVPESYIPPGGFRVTEPGPTVFTVNVYCCAKALAVEKIMKKARARVNCMKKCRLLLESLIRKTHLSHEI